MKPSIEQVPSPNFHRVEMNRKVSCVIIHATATTGLDSPLEWLCNKKSKVSAHYLISAAGRIIQLVAENDIAWHAGDSEWAGARGVNVFSIGIELVNANDGKMAYPVEQLDACARLVADICLERDIHIKDVVGHEDIAPGRKTDPMSFPWDDFENRLFASGVAA